MGNGECLAVCHGHETGKFEQGTHDTVVHYRNVCTVYVDGKDVGLAQLDAGLAWWFRKYAHEQHPKDRIHYDAAEDRAAADRVGLWQDKNPVPPWEWRHNLAVRMGQSGQSLFRNAN